MKRRLKTRRWKNTAAVGVALAGCAAWVAWLDTSLARSAYATGYALFAAVVFLAAYQLRKKLPGLPLGSSRGWLRAHLIVAIASGGLFYWHVGGRWPGGAVEATLATLYAATFLSGVWGLYLSRTLPRRLARTGEPFVYERIPRLRWQVQNEARDIVLGAVEASGATTLADFYTDRLHGFFQRPRAFGYALRPTTATRRRIFHELRATRRYLTDDENTAAERLFSLVRRKDDLDFHASRQGMLKLWLFVHIGLTWALLTGGLAHGVVALAFRGGPTP